MSVVYVGATNVGSMNLGFDKNMKTNRKLDAGYQKCLVTEYDRKSYEGEGVKVEAPYT